MAGTKPKTLADCFNLETIKLGDVMQIVWFLTAMGSGTTRKGGDGSKPRSAAH